MSRRVRIVLIVLGAAFLLFLLDTAYEGYKTLKLLDVVESERDAWQRPEAILAALNLKHGDLAVDLGSGSGYFSLKLSSAVGASGKVLAVDIRRLSLMFLWVRSLMKDSRNIDVVLGRPDNAPLSSGTAAAVLILNTYHEVENRQTILPQVFQSLVPGGRLVVVDPMKTEHGELTAGMVEDELRRYGFAIARSDERFIEQHDGSPWWLIVAQRPW